MRVRMADSIMGGVLSTALLSLNGELRDDD
jgi:hypothetical protein